MRLCCVPFFVRRHGWKHAPTKISCAFNQCTTLYTLSTLWHTRLVLLHDGVRGGKVQLENPQQVRLHCAPRTTPCPVSLAGGKHCAFVQSFYPPLTTSQHPV